MRGDVLLYASQVAASRDELFNLSPQFSEMLWNPVMAINDKLLSGPASVQSHRSTSAPLTGMLPV